MNAKPFVIRFAGIVFGAVGLALTASFATGQQPNRLHRLKLQNNQPRSVSAATQIKHEAETIKHSASQGTLHVQNMAQFGSWSGNQQLLWIDGQRGSRMELTFNSPKAGLQPVQVVMTRAADFADVSIGFSGRQLAKHSGFSDKVVKTNVKLGKLNLQKGANVLVFHISGKHKRSTGYRAGIDCVIVGSPKLLVLGNAAGLAKDSVPNRAPMKQPQAPTSKPTLNIIPFADKFSSANANPNLTNAKMELLPGARIWARNGDVLSSNIALVGKSSAQWNINFEWDATKIPHADGVCVQICNKVFPPFRGVTADLTLPSLVRGGLFERSMGNRLSVDGAFLLKENGGKDLYVRVVPFVRNGREVVVAGKPSNPMVIRRETGQESDLVPSGPPFVPNIRNVLPVTITLNKFIIDNADEDGLASNGDEPYLIPIMIVADGGTINVLDIANAHVKLVCPAKTHGNLGLDGVGTGTWNIPTSIGVFKTDLKAIQAGPAVHPIQASRAAQVGMLVIAVEEDGTSKGTADEIRAALIKELQKQLDSELRSALEKIIEQVVLGNQNPRIRVDIQKITDAVMARVKSAGIKGTLSRFWNVAGIADRDDVVGVQYQAFNMYDLWHASYHNGEGTDFQMEFRDDEHGIRYRVLGTAKSDSQ